VEKIHYVYCFLLLIVNILYVDSSGKVFLYSGMSTAIMLIVRIEFQGKEAGSEKHSHFFYIIFLL